MTNLERGINASGLLHSKKFQRVFTKPLKPESTNIYIFLKKR
jgi:hypothetical protein